jgi:hypothetical protein
MGNLPNALIPVPALRSASAAQRRSPRGGRARLFPKVNVIAVFEIPACRAPQGRPLRSATNISGCFFLSPFRKTSLPIADMAVFLQAGVFIGRLPHGTPVLLAVPANGMAEGLQRGRPRGRLGVFRLTPGRPSRQPIEPLPLVLARLLARFSPHNSPDTLCRFFSKCVREGKNPHIPYIG